MTIASVGTYGITVKWSDGHSTGIYAFEGLRALGERGTVESAEDV